MPESQRFCRTCGAPVGRERNGRPGLTRGFCTKDGTPFSFAPTLSAGDLVDRYEIDRCIARGGQGWIYLARDTHLSDSGAEHHVVLKGLIDTEDQEAVEQAVQERRYLIDVDHPNIVKINDFVQHPDPLTGTMAGYIVMEYIDGRSLLELHRGHRDELGRRASMPLAHVLAYGLEVLQALGHLHEKGLLYCDFKPDNAMQTGDQLKLIDLGAVVRADSLPRTFLGTPGYQAPEVEETGPSVLSDLYTVGRSLAVLSFKFEGFSGKFRHTLPPQQDIPLLTEQESYYRFLRRATHPQPELRFSSAAEMRGQLEGVLLEVLSAQDQEARPAVSTWFTVERRTFGTDAGVADQVDWSAVGQALPSPLVDPRDPGASYLAAIAAADPDDVIEMLVGIPVSSPEVVLQLAGARIAAGEIEAAREGLDDYAETAPHDWRVAWYRGLAALADGDPDEARTEFEMVYDALPGELPPKLALAASAEWDGDDRAAGPLYQRVWHTDNRYLSAAFGVARVSRRSGDLTAVMAALDDVPAGTQWHVPAKILVLRAALDWVSANHDFSDTGMVLGHPLEDRPLRFGLEKAYRDLAKVTDDIDRRIALVKAANKVRPRTLF
ncbi:serine/threonine-protein kinase PknG [Kibdelosporangium banguiense]|uniref:non-specific serine/threonine protein kinase n=1 Tax=Kibdelosporangium banguiense TaxID=1365924 RepID=A0ABS4TUN0_9PSEU|nr:serine/threonine-protein kinase PknG [Kibdelosporangium banguiense]